MLKAKHLWIIHLLGWLLFLSLPLTIVSRQPGFDFPVIALRSVWFWLFFLIYAVLFYGNLHLLIPRLYLKQHYAAYAGIFIGLLALVYASKPFERLIFQRFQPEPRWERRDFAEDAAGGGRRALPANRFPEGAAARSTDAAAGAGRRGADDFSKNARPQDTSTTETENDRPEPRRSPVEGAAGGGRRALPANRFEESGAAPPADDVAGAGRRGADDVSKNARPQDTSTTGTENDRPEPRRRGFAENTPLPPFAEPRGMPGPGPNEERAVDFVSLTLFLVVWVVAMAIRISREWRQSERRAILSEAEKAHAELSFFKAQINPHFLFNTLNNIYALAVTSSAHTAPSILKLSQMMRYITEEATENFVPLSDELACLENYVELQKLRLNAKTTLAFEVQGSADHITIAPLILMTFVENAFKYGVSNHHDSWIRIAMEIAGQEIRFFCENRIFERNGGEEREGVGMANTRKRLDLLYPGAYHLDIASDGEIFTVHLKLTSS